MYIASLFNPNRANHATIVRCLKESTTRYPALLNQIMAKCCLVAMKRNGMTEYVARTPLNDLTQPQFVFMVLDMMKNCAMEPLADEIMSYVGVNVRLPSELDVAKVELKRQMWQEASRTKQQFEHINTRVSRLEQTMVEQEANRKRDHDAMMASHAAVMTALAAIRGLPADQGGGGGDGQSKKK